MVAVGMGQSVGADLPTLELLEDPAAVDPQAGVDEDVADHVDVGGIGREARELPEGVGELLHAAQPSSLAEIRYAIGMEW